VLPTDPGGRTPLFSYKSYTSEAKLETRVSDNTWDRVLGRIESKVSRHSFSTWFKPTSFLTEDASSISVRVPNSWFAEWLETNYSGLIQDALRSVDRPGLSVQFRPDEPIPAPSRPPVQNLLGGNGASSDRRKLNPKYTFGTFVVSSCNQFAHAASVAVAEQPTRAYNPLYVYGGVGLGKTHLMQAIGNRIAESENMSMTYVSSEAFMNQMINAIRFERTLEFKERYRNVDVLLIDDIQFLAGKERTQEEFFHTFNALYDAQKQIVITSDVPPREIPTLEERLRSRFEWGLIADIQPPDLETKVAILRKKAESDGTPIPDDVALFIASNCGSNIRELEGALTKIVAYASMSGRQPSLELAKETLHDFLPSESPAATVDSIMKTVANYYNLPVIEIKSKNNSPQISFPRQVAMYLCKKLTDCSLPEIGRRFGGKHHSTVIHAIQKIEKKRKAEKDFDKLVENFEQSV
jgi:chromosomal replication initiator protein